MCISCILAGHINLARELLILVTTGLKNRDHPFKHLDIFTLTLLYFLQYFSIGNDDYNERIPLINIDYANQRAQTVSGTLQRNAAEASPLLEARQTYQNDQDVNRIEAVSEQQQQQQFITAELHVPPPPPESLTQSYFQDNSKRSSFKLPKFEEMFEVKL